MIKNLQVIRNVLTSLILISLISACASSRPPVEMITTEIERSKLSIPSVDTVKLDKVSWMLVTEENVTKVFEDINKKKFNPVLFSLTDKGYEKLSVNFAKVRALVMQQQAVIAAYKDYYETTIEKDKEEQKVSSEQKEANPPKKSFLSNLKIW